MTVIDFCNFVMIFKVPCSSKFHMARDPQNSKPITYIDTTSMKALVWVSSKAFMEAPLEYGPLAEFSADVGVDSLEFVEAIQGMSNT